MEIAQEALNKVQKDQGKHDKPMQCHAQYIPKCDIHAKW